ncbi:MAG TPA: hypothetical protein PLV92_29480, partial [Pirellulaceae bacterium]|nr:hypothetical protein [Pirellulaceae bacterium]
LTTLRSGRPNGCNLCHLDKSLGWTAGHLSNWYGHSTPPMSDDERNVAVGVLGVLSGDAGQRAVVGWNLGWAPAIEASGRDWQTPLLAELMRDNYDVVRMIGYRSLRNLQGMERAPADYDFVGPAQERERVVLRLLEGWRAERAERVERSAVLLDGNGDLIDDAWKRLLQRRNTKPVVLLE